MSERTESPVFVVGPSRSGTALVRSVLNASDQVFLAGETHYFDDLRPRLEHPRTPLPSEWRQKVADYFLAISHRPYGHGGDAAGARVDAGELERLACELGDSGDAWFEAYCRLTAMYHRPPNDAPTPDRWGEKTPRHVYRVADILAAFPRAKIVAVIRDPRAILASYGNWRNQGGFDLERDPGHAEALDSEHVRASRSYHPVIASVMVKSAIASSSAALDRFGPGRVALVKYEDLTEDPQPVVERLCSFLDLDFDSSMLAAPVHNSSFQTFDRDAGITRQSVERWRDALDPAEVAVAQLLCRGVMERFDYRMEHVDRSSYGAVAKELLTAPAAAVRASGSNRDRIADLPSYVWRRLAPTISRSSSG